MSSLGLSTENDGYLLVERPNLDTEWFWLGRNWRANVALFEIQSACAPNSRHSETNPERASALRDIKAIVNGQRTPIFIDGKKVAGYNGTATIFGGGCATIRDWATPAVEQAGKRHPAAQGGEPVIWMSPLTIAITPGIPDYVGVRRENDTKIDYYYAGSSAKAVELKAAMDRLAKACRPEHVASSTVDSRVVDAFSNFNVDLPADWNTPKAAGTWPSLAGLSPALAANIRDCRRKFEDTSGERLFERLQLRPGMTDAAAEIIFARNMLASDLVSSYVYRCADEDLIETPADAEFMDYDRLEASAKPIAAAAAARAEADFTARANKILLATRPKVSQSGMQAEVDAITRYASMTNICGTPNLSPLYLDRYSRSSVSDYNSRYNSNVAIANCLKDYWDSRGAKKPLLNEAYGWAHRVKFFTCDKWKSAACLPSSEFSSIWKFTSNEATARIKAFEDAYYNDQRNKAEALNFKIRDWLENQKRMYPD
ncbi:hypothetical protein [Qipengyuania sp. JC766]|uniref:hypothetical protein n=1 Tax=Qipengyuania sp. JC766 TaxID=3232139 RepID=UPI00345ACDE3